MQHALSLAKKGTQAVSPNPKVGCVIVKRGQIVGKGYHLEFGGQHAEAIALEQAGHKARDSILYVTLEPCAHWGKTPPCTEQIVDSGVREVIIGMKDPNPIVNGYEVLKMRGLKARIGILEDECRQINLGYIKYMQAKLPYVTLKAGMTLDGKIATSSGQSKYITGTEARTMVHALRAEKGMVMVGINTVLKDDPLLDARMTSSNQHPAILLMDTSLRIPPNAKILKRPDKVIIACAQKAPAKKRKKLEKMGAKVLSVALKGKEVDLRKALKAVADLGYVDILLEGGSQLNASMIKENLVDKVMLFTSPKILGGDALSVVGKLGIKELGNTVTLKDMKVSKVGKDILIEGSL